jgi:hypothetical protein
MIFSMTGQEIGDCLIEETAWAGLIVFTISIQLLSGLIRGGCLWWEWTYKRGTSVSSNHDILHSYNLCIESDDQNVKSSNSSVCEQRAWWMNDCCWTPIFQLYHGEDKLHFDEMMMKSTLYEINRLSWVLIVLIETIVGG